MKAHIHFFITASGTAALLFTGAALGQTPTPSVASPMKAIVYHDYGSPDVLRLEEVEKPVPDDNQLLIRVRAASVNPLDWHYMRGTPYFMRMGTGLRKPTVTQLGVDYAGTVESVGRNVTRFKPGDEVFGGRTGAFAEYVCIGEHRAVAMKPANVTFEQAASVPIAALTALQGLRDKGKLQPGQRVLINGASGGVGTFAVQIAKSFGADVTGVCSSRNADMVRSIGADHVVDYTREDFTRSGQQYDLILDMVANHSLSDYRRALTPEGKLVLVGSRQNLRWLGFLTLMAKPAVYSRFVSQEMSFMMADLNKEDLAILGDLMQAGKVTPVIDRRYRLSELPAAIAYLEDGHARGKVVISVDEENEPSPLSTPLAAGPVSTLGSDLIVLSLIAIVIGAPLFVARALNRRFQQRNPGKRPYRWGYYFSIESMIGGIVLGVVLEAGITVAIVCGVIYAVLAWFFAQRHRWAWVTLTILSLNPVAWVINGIYLWRRWADDAVARPAA